MSDFIPLLPKDEEKVNKAYDQGLLREDHNPDNLTLVGKGGCGCCYIRNDKDGAVIVKEAHCESNDIKDVIASLEREDKIGAKFSGHDNFRQYYKFIKDDKLNTAVLEMQLLLGYYNLDEIIKNLGPLSLDVEDRIISQLVEAIEFMHRPGHGLGEVTHGDLKPGNVMINPKDFSLKLIDFGMAHIAGEEITIPSDSGKYSAPEQKNQENPVKDILTDIYSIGKILLDINPVRYKKIADKASSINRSDRYQSMAELREAYVELYDSLKTFTDWDAKKWKESFIAALVANDFSAKKELRRKVYGHSISVVRNGGYDYGEGTVKINDFKAVRKSISYSKEFETEPIESGPDVTIDVVRADTLKEAGKMVNEGLHPAVLCACNRQTPKSSGGQEGDMLRRTDLWRFTYQYEKSGVYPLDPNWGGIYSRGVTAFRGEEEDGYPLLGKPVIIDVISVPAINRPTLNRGRLTPGGKRGTFNKIRTIFRIAKDNGNDSLVLSAFGCGNYENPPQDIADIFKKVLAEDEFRHSFRKVLFAIKEDRNSHANCGSEGGNYGIFKRVLVPIE